MSKKRIIWVGIPLLFILIALLGPSPTKPVYTPELPEIDLTLKALSDSISKSEFSNPSVKPNNQARIVWADSVPGKTEWAIVYLHGFSASQMEGFPVHQDIASKYGMNLYLARLSDHGLRSDSALLKLTPDRLWESAKEALVVGSKIGRKVLIMSTSTGGTLALKLAEQYPGKVDGLINYSPNIRINNPLAWFLNNPWGGEVLSLVADNGYVNTTGRNDSIISQYWNTHYRMESLPQLEELVETTMTKKVFTKVTCPSLTIAYFKNEENQDGTVKVAAMRWMHDLLGTPNSSKRFVELPNVGVHPLASALRSKDIPGVEKETEKFIEEVLGIRPKP